MPREHRKHARGKRKKREREEHGEDGGWHHDEAYEEHGWEEPVTKKTRSEDWHQKDYLDLDVSREAYYQGEYAQGAEEPPSGGHDEFYGLLNEDDQSYFKRIEALFELDQFESVEAKELFIQSVWREADGKELKLACSQSCSRILERLIRASPPTYLKQLFQRFSNHFLFLVQHRFASHCCETLLITAAPEVTNELVAPMTAPAKQDGGDDEIFVSMENLFLFTFNELSDHMGFLVTDPFASHSLRVLLIVLSGKPLDDAVTASSRPGKNRDHADASEHRSSSDRPKQWRTVPSSFHEAAEKATTSIIGGLDTHYLRTLTTHTLASKILQLLVELEFHQTGNTKHSDAGTLYRRLVPEENPSEETESGRFLKGLVYDAVGSHLLEVIVQYAPGKIFKRLYRSFFEPQIAGMAKNDTASFVLVRVIERLSGDDLNRAIDALGVEMPVLLSRQRHAVIRALIERSRARSLDVQPLVNAIEQHYGQPGPETLVYLLQPESASIPSTLQATEAPNNRNASQYHARLLASSMLHRSDAAQAYLLSSLGETPSSMLVQLACDRHATFVVQTALTHPSIPVRTRRALVQNLAAHAPQLAEDFIGSHVVSALWTATDGALFFLKERVIQHLSDAEQIVRSTPCGRAIWRNWRVEVWRREKREWVLKARELERERLAKGEGPGAESTNHPPKQEANDNVAESSNTGKNTAESSGKSALELARERWMAKKKGAGGRGRDQDARIVRVR